MSKALLIVDPLVDLCEGGAIEIPGGNDCVAAIVAMLSEDPATEGHVTYDLVLVSRDWHDPDSTNGGHFAFPPDRPDYVNTWPIHCVQGTPGAEFAPAFATYIAANPLPVAYRGMGTPGISALDGFVYTTEGPLSVPAYLSTAGVTEVALCGLGASTTIRTTAYDLLSSAMPVSVLPTLCVGRRAIDGVALEHEIEVQSANYLTPANPVQPSA